MDEVLDVLKQWKLDLGAVREQVYRAPTPHHLGQQSGPQRRPAACLLDHPWPAAPSRPPAGLQSGLQRG